MSTLTIDLPAFNVNGTWETVRGYFAGDTTDNWSTPDTATESLIPPYFRGGVGYFAQSAVSGGGFPHLIYMPATPAGYSLTRATYVLIAYREANDGSAGSGWPFPDYNPTPTEIPFLYGESSGTSDQYVFNDIPVGAYAGEQEWPGDEILSRITPSSGMLPANRLWSFDNFPLTTVIHVAYYAIRLTYTSAGTIQPPLRQVPRTDGLGASSVVRHYPPSRSAQASNRRAGGYL